uniref:ATP-dependent Clp protease proteolytic subunit n=1 Tax=Kirchneriella aperta TaxID=117505 RepID=A0A140HA03_9CHLO|nr:proteolytic subunit 2 of clp protease [Kirchneriella aperta]AMO01002.1 proteolytic subunit 2 of clp protease [Kirchneriella aperta]
MPIGVPRIIYCWGEELPAQWTDIYNFIFRRRMVFLMQYLDDELCNQICGLLINIHMEDRSKELEKKEMEKSGLFKNQTVQRTSNSGMGPSDTNAFSESSGSLGMKKERSIEDLMISEEDLGIDENHMLERRTLQKISLEWLNWNAQFFDYSDEPYLFYLAELLSKDLTGDKANLGYSFYLNGTNPPASNGLTQNFQSDAELPRFMTLFKQMSRSNPQLFQQSNLQNSLNHLNIYSPFRFLKNLANSDSILASNSDSFLFNSHDKNHLAEKLQQLKKEKSQKKSNIENLISDVAQKDLLSKLESQENEWAASTKALAQRQIRRNYSQDFTMSNLTNKKTKYQNYLNLGATEDASYLEYRDYYRKQTERTLQDEESKKVFMIINSFGGSVGNGITVHDALQFIKAGSMTLALGVAASAASLALAGGTIGERYVTEGCHVMIHQPESGLSGQASDIWIDSQEIMKIRLDVAEIYSLSTYRPRHKILRDLDRDFYLTATETIYYGLADEIATNETLHEIIEMTSKVWDYHDAQQQKLLETRESLNSGLDTQTQN